MFNGSASLRDAAGQLIENTTKSVRRKETVDDGYMEALFEDMKSLYRLDQLGGQGITVDKDNLGPLPTESVLLLCALALVWICMGIYVFCQWRKQKRM